MPKEMLDALQLLRRPLRFEWKNKPMRAIFIRHEQSTGNAGRFWPIQEFI